MSTLDTKFIRRLQDHATAKLLSEPLLQYVSVASMRKQVLLAPAQRVAPHLAGRNGKVGAGILVNLPSADPVDNDIPGAQMTIQLAIDIMVKDDISLVVSNGARITAEEIVTIVWQLLHEFLNRDVGSGNWFVSGFDPVDDAKGAYGYRLLLSVRSAQDQPAKCSTPLYSLNAGMVTLTAVEGGSAIYYSLDESFPGSGAVAPNGNAVLYNAPFAVASGQVVLFASYLNNYIGSDVGLQNIP